MGYLGNHLATVVTGAFAAVLTGLWPYFADMAPILNFVFIMAVPITWFLAFTCWISQKSADYMHRHAPPAHGEKKSLGEAQAAPQAAPAPDIGRIRDELSAELEGIKESVKVKDEEIERLNEQIASLQTLVQIESLRTELANLKLLASKS